MPTVLITGANRGLGLEFARQYAAEGWRVIATCRDPERADALHSLGAEVHQLEVTDRAAIAALAAKLAAERIDLMIANAGVMTAPRHAPPEEVRAFAQEMGINYPIVMASNELTAEYGGVAALPTSFVVSPDSRIVQKHVGLFPIEVYDREVRALLGMHVDVPIETFEDHGQIFLKNAALATSLPGVEFRGLTAKQKRAALKRMNSENCTCGCKMTIAQCRINDPTCSTSQKLATEIVHEIRSRAPATPSAATAAR